MSNLKSALLAAICTALLFIGLKFCKPEPVIIPNNNEIIKIREKIKLTTIHDTINQIRTQYRLRIDTFVQKINASTTWDDLCRSLSISDTSQCKRLLAARYLQYSADSVIIGAYSRQRHRDSINLTLYASLDSLQQKQITSMAKDIVKLNKRAKNSRIKGNIKSAVAFIAGYVLSGLR